MPPVAQTEAERATVPVGDVQSVVLCGDNRDVLPTLPKRSFDLVVTSPPYWRQREYGSAGVGNERTMDAYLDALLDTFLLLLPLLRPTANIVYNLGDKFVGGSLMLIPYRFALRVVDELGLLLVNDITWVKANPVPHQFARRLTSSTEPFFHFATSGGYYHDRDGFAPLDEAPRRRSAPSKRLGGRYRVLIEGSELTDGEKRSAIAALDEVVDEVGRGDLHSFRMKIRGVHAPAYGGQGGGRKTHIERDGFTVIRIPGNPMRSDVMRSPVETIRGNGHPAVYPEAMIGRIVRMLSPVGGDVLDHYAGSGTSMVAAARSGRNSVGIDANPGYCRLAVDRLESVARSSPVSVGRSSMP